MIEEPADVLLVTATGIETRAVLDIFQTELGRKADVKPESENAYHDLGVLCDQRVWLVQSGMGSSSSNGSLLVVQAGIKDVCPSSVVMVGTAFGLKPNKQAMGDILISERLSCYEPQRLGTDGSQLKTILRGARPEASNWVLQRFRAANADWNGASVHFGVVLSGEKLVDNVDFRDQLLAFEPEAIGGEMEGAGLYVACQRAKSDWILVKSICDWADGKKAEDQQARQAADNAANFVLYVLKKVGLKRSSDAGASCIPTAREDPRSNHSIVPPAEPELIEVEKGKCIRVKDRDGHVLYSFPWAFGPVGGTRLKDARHWKALHSKAEGLYLTHRYLVERMILARVLDRDGRDRYKGEAKGLMMGVGAQFRRFSTELRQLPILSMPIVEALAHLSDTVEPIQQSLETDASFESFESGVLLAERIGDWLLDCLHIADQVLEKYFRQQP